MRVCVLFVLLITLATFEAAKCPWYKILFKICSEEEIKAEWAEKVKAHSVEVQHHFVILYKDGKCDVEAVNKLVDKKYTTCEAVNICQDADAGVDKTFYAPEGLFIAGYSVNKPEEITGTEKSGGIKSQHITFNFKDSARCQWQFHSGAYLVSVKILATSAQALVNLQSNPFV